uniref:Uncharacterized protein n=1 Tax=Nelumbo nucifera TaxID=4432 RepID=A0A822Z0Z3_NELNU|nr:TPA_asm: hypothetical protein HUJ06_005788 [Nelumbo nucifera]
MAQGAKEKLLAISEAVGARVWVRAEKVKVKLPSLLPVRNVVPVPHEVRTRPEELIYALSFMIVISLIQLPYEYIDGNPIPTVIFKGQPTTFHAFILSLVFSFSGSACAMMLREHYPKAAGYCRRFGLFAFSLAFSVFLWAAIPDAFRLLSSLTSSS